MKASSALSLAINELLTAREQKASPDYKNIIAKLIDSIVLTGHVCKELTFKRRDSLCPYLSGDFKPLCGRNIKPGKYNFGDDLPETLKQLKATSRLVNAATSVANQSFVPHRGYNGRSNFSQYQGSSSTARPSFLGNRGKLPYPSPRQNNRQPHFAKRRFIKN